MRKIHPVNIMGLLDAPTMGMVEINGIRTEGIERQGTGGFFVIKRSVLYFSLFI